jgi:hypothetical protein
MFKVPNKNRIRVRGIKRGSPEPPQAVQSLTERVAKNNIAFSGV